MNSSEICVYIYIDERCIFVGYCMRSVLSAYSPTVGPPTPPWSLGVGCLTVGPIQDQMTLHGWLNLIPGHEWYVQPYLALQVSGGFLTHTCSSSYQATCFCRLKIFLHAFHCLAYNQKSRRVK